MRHAVSRSHDELMCAPGGERAAARRVAPHPSLSAIAAARTATPHDALAVASRRHDLSHRQLKTEGRRLKRRREEQQHRVTRLQQMVCDVTPTEDVMGGGRWSDPRSRLRPLAVVVVVVVVLTDQPATPEPVRARRSRVSPARVRRRRAARRRAPNARSVRAPPPSLAAHDRHPRPVLRRAQWARQWRWRARDAAAALASLVRVERARLAPRGVRRAALRAARGGWRAAAGGAGGGTMIDRGSISLVILG